jgi:tyrosyl-tRNA synthetase
VPVCVPVPVPDFFLKLGELFMGNVIDCLQERGLIEAMTSEEIRRFVETPMKIYVGFDPTADSLHLGNLVGIIILAWFQRYGHTPVVLLGGATGRIGDPSGKSVERPLLDQATIAANIAGIRTHFERVLDFFQVKTKPIILNNDDWFAKISFVDFLRDTGKHFRLGPMLAKESVRARLSSEEGMSFTEFSYQLLQAYDFQYLLGQHGVRVQGGGSDQWGNITAGVELIRKLSGETAYGITWPLLTRSDGKKFGKSEQGAIWLSPERCSPYQFYQYLVRIPDADVIKLMRMLTFMDLAEIADYEKQMGSPSYVPNTAQKRLAEELTRLMHGDEGVQAALQATEVAAPGSKGALDPALFKEISADMPNMTLTSEEVVGQKYVDLMVKVGLQTSKGESVRLIQGGGAYLNNEKVEDQGLRLTAEHLIGGEYLLLGAGKKKKLLVNVRS